jgi:hypothetical protein
MPTNCVQGIFGLCLAMTTSTEMKEICLYFCYLDVIYGSHRDDHVFFFLNAFIDMRN